MGNGFNILVTDRNRHVREFLRRELMAEGYLVQVAKDGLEVLTLVDGMEPPDLVILDPEIPYTGGLRVLQRLLDRDFPVVVHTFLGEDPSYPDDAQSLAAFVEKCENTDRLKTVVGDMLRKSYPLRFSVEEGQGRQGPALNECLLKGKD